jgi:hypothetical protein
MNLRLFRNPAVASTLEKIDQRQLRKAGTENLMRILPNTGTVFTIITANVFKEASRNFLMIFLLHKTAYKFQNHFRIYRKYWFNLIGLKKYSFDDPVPIYNRQNSSNSFNVKSVYRRFSTGFSNSQPITTQQTTYVTQEYTILMHNACDSSFASATQNNFPYAE